MIVPLHQLRHGGIEATHVFIEQVVGVIAAKFGQGLGHFGLFRGGEIFPDAPIIQCHLGLDEAIGIDVIAIVNKQIRLHPVHDIVQLHTAPVRIDAESLPSRIPGPHDVEVALRFGRGQEAAHHGLAILLGGGEIFEVDAIKNALPGRQTGEVEFGGKICGL